MSGILRTVGYVDMMVDCCVRVVEGRMQCEQVVVEQWETAGFVISIYFLVVVRANVRQSTGRIRATTFF